MQEKLTKLLKFDLRKGIKMNLLRWQFWLRMIALLLAKSSMTNFDLQTNKNICQNVEEKKSF